MQRDRAHNALRNVKIEPGYSQQASSVIIHMGNTIVHCTASVTDKVPPFVEEGSGWVTAEYAMLPGSTFPRSSRDRGRKVGGRTMEIQRLIGRSLRGITNLDALGPRAIYLDCDVLNADGGTRCASITGAYIALVQALKQLEAQGELKVDEVIRTPVAAISVGIVDSELLLDLEYKEDSSAEVDFNIVMTGELELIEVQGTAEGKPFSRDQLNQLIDLGAVGITELIKLGASYLETV